MPPRTDQLGWAKGGVVLSSRQRRSQYAIATADVATIRQAALFILKGLKQNQHVTSTIWLQLNKGHSLDGGILCCCFCFCFFVCAFFFSFSFPCFLSVRFFPLCVILLSSFSFGCRGRGIVMYVGMGVMGFLWVLGR